MFDFKILHPVRWIYKFNEHCARECSLMIGRACRRKWDFSLTEKVRFKFYAKLEWWSRKLTNRRWKYPLTDKEIEQREKEMEEMYRQNIGELFDYEDFTDPTLGEPWEKGEEPDPYFDDLYSDPRDFH